jgi:hypothetical protein
MPLTFNAIYLGNSPIALDPTEGNNLAENAGLFVGQTFGGPGAALAGQWVSFTSVNNGGVASALDMNNSVVNDQAIINNGSGPVTYVFDGTSVYNGFITYIDGSTSGSVPFVLVQMTNGDLYLVPSPTSPTPTNTALSADQIQSITFTSLVGNTYSGMGADRPVISFMTCFTPGALIATPQGPRRIETLQAGDLVSTRDNGDQPLRWIGFRSLGAEELRANPDLRPIRIEAGALGNGLPERALVVSPQHRMLVRSRIVAKMFGQPEVLVAAKHLLGIPGISVCEAVESVDYWHFICNRHEVVFSEGAPTESLYLGRQTLAGLSAASRREIELLFPELFCHSLPELAPAPARMLVRGRQGRTLCRRHAKNIVPLVA